jgi:hypothetical protein
LLELVQPFHRVGLRGRPWKLRSLRRVLSILAEQRRGGERGQDQALKTIRPVYFCGPISPEGI